MKIVIRIEGEYCELRRGWDCPYLRHKLYNFYCAKFSSPLVNRYLAYRDSFVGIRCNSCLALDKKEKEG